jgi:DNA-binding SARP family transcriptional activator
MFRSHLPVEHLEIHLLGAFMVVCAGVQIASLRAPRLQALLAYLLLHRGAPQPRQRIAFLFWPETSDRQAQTNLRQLLHTFRQRIPHVDACLQVDEHTLTWRSSAPCTLDVAEFEAALATAAPRTGAARIAALEAAVAAYAGDLLPDCYDDWILAPREQLAQKFVAALEQLILLHEEQRSYAAAIAHAQRLLAYDPLHEATYRHLMRLHALNGDRAAALRVYHTCVSLLDRELAAPPSVATRETYEQLLQVDETHPTHHSPQSPFVGRAAAWQELQQCWRSVHRGGLHVVCIQGEAGIGKTRIAEELLHWARQQGIRTLHAHAFSTENNMSYAPLVDALRAPAAQPALAQIAPVWRTELARLLPELLAADPALPAPEPLTEGWQRQHLYDALLRAVTPDAQPLILLLDDLQWCDAETLDWLLYLVNHRMDARLLLVAAERSEEMTPEHPAARFLLELRRLGVLTDLPLAALDAAETALLADGVAGQKLASAHARQIYAATEGNPLFVVETVRSLDAIGATGEVVLPPKVQGVIRARLAQLSPAARDLAGVAATIGRSFSADVLAAACDRDEDAVVRGLDELWQRRIVREQGANGYDFTHDRLREVAYGELRPAERRLLHRRVAHALEVVYAADAETVSAHIARHLELGGDARGAIHYYRSAAEVALRLFAYNEAIALLRSALALVATLPASAAAIETELELQIRLCTAWAAVTSYLGREVEQAYTRALELCRQVGQTPHLFAVLWGLHEVALYRTDYQASVELAHQCLEIAEQLGDPGLLLEAHHAAWGPYFFLGEYERAFAHIHHGLHLYQHAEHEPLSVVYGVHDACACAFYESALACWQMGLLDQARAWLARSIAHTGRLTMPANLADAAAYAALVYHLLRDPAHAQATADRALSLSVERGYPYPRFLASVALGWSLAVQGEPAQGVSLARQGMAASVELGQRLHHSQLAAMLAEACLLAGHCTEALDVVDEAIASFADYRDLICAPELWLLKGEALAAAGAEADQVEACQRTALALAQELGAKTSELRAATQLARLLQRQGRPGEGLLVLTERVRWFTEGRDTPDLLAAQQLLAELTGAGA